MASPNPGALPAAAGASLHASDPLELLAALRAEMPYLGNSEFRFRPLVEADSARLYDASRHPEFNRYIPIARSRDVAHATRQVQDMLATQSSGRLAVMACVRGTDFDNWSGILRVSPWRDGLEMGLWAHPDAWGGNGSRIARLAVAVGFHGCATPCVYAKADHRNRAGQRVLEYCFMRRIGRAEAPTESGERLSGDEWVVSREDFARAIHAAPRAEQASRRTGT